MRALFLADQFADANRTPEEHAPGGAELTDEAAIAACPWPIHFVTCAQADQSAFAQYDVLVVGNADSASPELLRAVAATGRHVMFEHDVRICKWRGNYPAAGEPIHRVLQRCWCPHERWADLYRKSRGVIFLTERQRAHFTQNPFFAKVDHAVLGCSLFGESFWASLERRRATERRDTAVFGSRHRIKGFEIARCYVLDRGLEPKVLRDLPYSELLRELSRIERFVYLPIALEPAGRMPVEARMLGCEVVVNEHLGIGGEAWWSQARGEAEAHLRGAPRRFWEHVEAFLGGSAKRSRKRLVQPLSPAARFLLEQRRRLQIITNRIEDYLEPGTRSPVHVCAPW